MYFKNVNSINSDIIIFILNYLYKKLLIILLWIFYYVKFVFFWLLKFDEVKFISTSLTIKKQIKSL